MKKYRLFYNPEKMENFINNMAAKGYGLTKISGCVYEFTNIQPCQYKYKIDFLNGKNETEINNYISFVTESGTYFVARSGKIVVFAKETDFQLYTDVESKIKAYTRTKNHFLIMMLLCVIFTLVHYKYYKLFKRQSLYFIMFANIGFTFVGSTWGCLDFKIYKVYK